MTTTITKRIDRALGILVQGDGPGSFTQNAIARLSANGDINDSDVTIDDNGVMAGAKVLATGASTARLFADRFFDILSVKDFGAVGDGATDDTAAINAAEFALNAAGGGTLHFPEGTYIVTGVTKRTGTIWQGDGIGRTILKLKAATTANAVVQGLNAYTLFGTSSYAGIFDWALRDLTIDGNRANSGASDGLGVFGYAFDIENIEIQNCSGHGIRSELPIAVDGSLATHSDNASSWVADCLIHDNNGRGIYWAGPQDSVFEGNYIYRNTGTANFQALLPGGVALKISNCHVWGSSVATRQAATGYLIDTIYNTLINCTAEGSTGQQIWLRSHSNKIIGGTIFYANAQPNSVYGVRLGDTGGGLPTSQNTIITEIVDCQAGAIYFDSDQGSNTILVNGFNSTATTIGYAGTPSPLGTILLNINGTSVTNSTITTLRSTLTVNGLVATGATAGVGYATGAGGAVTQGSGSGKATTVTLNTVTGQITMNNATLNAGVTVVFTVANSAVAATDVVVAHHSSGGTAGAYNVAVRGSGSAGSFLLAVTNSTGGNLSEAPVINFAVMKGVNS